MLCHTFSVSKIIRRDLNSTASLVILILVCIFIAESSLSQKLHFRKVYPEHSLAFTVE